MVSESGSRSPSAENSAFTVDEELVALPQYKQATTSPVDFDGLLSEPLRLHENLKSGCGGQLWPAGMTLAKHLLRYHRDKLGNARILELGAGGGLVGLAVARGCNIQNPVYITDQAEMEELMLQNIDLNSLENRVRARILNWGEPLAQEIIDYRPDTILAADCVYFEPAFPLLSQTLHDLLALSETSTIYFCFKKRRRADMQFLKNARKAFHVAEIEDEDRAIFRREGLFLFAFRRK